MAISSSDSKNALPTDSRTVKVETQVTARAAMASPRQTEPGLLLSLQPVQADAAEWLMKPAPRLHPPEADLSKFIELLRTLQQTITTADMGVAIVNAEFINSEIKKNREAAETNTDAIHKKNQEIESSQAGKKALSWGLCLVGLFLAILATVLTGGAAVPALVLAVADLANNIVHEIKPPVMRKNEFGEDVPLNISPTELIMCMTMESDVKSGKIRVIGFNADASTPGAVTRKRYDEIKSTMSLVVTILVVVVTIVASVASSLSKGAATVAKSAVDATEESATVIAQQASKAQTVAHIIGAGATLIAGLGGLAGSVMSFVLAFANKNLSEMRILSTEIDAMIQSLQQRFDIQQENFSSAMNFQNILRKLIADAMSEFNESSVAIAKNTRR